MRHSTILLAGLALALVGAAPALATECAGEAPVLRSETGHLFTPRDRARLEWRERSSGGKILTYGAEVWRGRVDGREAYLSFAHLPSVSGPNAHMAFKLERYPVRPRFATPAARRDMIDFFVVYSGPLKGAWSLEPCPAPR